MLVLSGLVGTMERFVETFGGPAWVGQYREYQDQHSAGVHRIHPHPAGLHCLCWLRAQTLHEVGKLGWNQKSLSSWA